MKRLTRGQSNQPEAGTACGGFLATAQALRKALLSVVFTLMAAALIALPLAGCTDEKAVEETPAQNDQASVTTPEADEPSFDLATFANPFIGTWESDIPSANTKLTFIYKPDGSFDFTMDGVPADQGGEGSGGYLVLGDVQVSYLDFEGAAAYVFEVVDNNTINVKEVLEVGENGAFVFGNTSPFKRVPDSPVAEKAQPFVLNNPFIGTWQALIPDDENPGEVFDITMEYLSNGLFKGTLAPDTVFPDAGYFVHGDVLVTFDPSSNEFEMFTFKQVDADTIDVTEFLSINEDGSRNLGETVPFNRVR
jgi:hypothetical protein